MKKLFSIILVIGFSMTLISCDNDAWKEKTAGIMAGSVSPVIASALTCSHPDAIKADIKAKIMELSWFKKEIQKESNKGMGASLCELAVGAVLPQLINFGADEIPEAWGCTAETAGQSIILLAKEGCKAIPY